jgi:hypothetical protein
MTKFQFETLNVNLSELVPARDDMKRLVEVFKDTVKEVTRTHDSELITSLCDGLGEVRLRGVCRRLGTPERAEMISHLLMHVKEDSSKLQELVSDLFDGAPNLVALHDTLDKVGFEKFRKDPVAKWFGERASLAEIVGEIKGAEFLNEEFSTIEDAELAIDRIETVLRHNASILESDDRLQHVPMAYNAKLLLAAFEERQEEMGDPIEFAQAWNERVKIHTSTGLGVYDTAELALSSDELRSIREGLDRFPTHVFAIQNVALGINFKSSAADLHGALGRCENGTIFLYDTVRGARPDVDFPEGAVDGVTFTTVRESSYSAHIVGLSEFSKLSGWVKVSKLSCQDPHTDAKHSLQRESFVPGELVDMDSGRYVVSFHVAPLTIDYPIGMSKEDPTKSDPESGFLFQEDAQFTNERAAMTPKDDYAETLTAFLLTPEKLKQLAPMKYEFMDLLYGRISR